MTPEQASAAAKRAVMELGDAYNRDPKTLRRVRRLGLTGWSFHVASRAGVLGDVRAATAAAAMASACPDAVASGWDAARKVATPMEIAESGLAECCRWGTEHLAALPGLTRLVELAERVVVQAEAAGMPLFAAGRAMPVPDDSPGAAAAVLFRLLREHRASAYALAVRASGLTPLEALIGGPEGEAGAVAVGWHPPYPAVAPLFRRRVWADALTERIAGQAYGVLAAQERIELVDLLDAALEAVPLEAVPLEAVPLEAVPLEAVPLVAAPTEAMAEAAATRTAEPLPSPADERTATLPVTG